MLAGFRGFENFGDPTLEYVMLFETASGVERDDVFIQTSISPDYTDYTLGGV